MTRKDHIALAAAMLETRPFHSEAEYRRMKQNRAHGAALIAQWETCVNAVCRALHRDNESFKPDLWLDAAGFITVARAMVH